MIAVPLRVLRSRKPAATAAWLLPGGDAAAWLDTIAALGVRTTDLVLHVVPRSAEDRSAAALVVVPPEPLPAGTPPAPPGVLALPLARRGARLLLPADGVLWPPLSDAEIDRTLGSGLHLVHPVHGFVAFDTGEALSVGDLLVAGERRDTRWDAADPGLRAPVLRSVRATEPPTAEVVLAAGRGDASTRPLAELPPAPGERRPERPGTGSRWLARLLLRLTRDAPRTASEPTWLDRAESWARAKLAVDVEDARAREIARLLHLLRTDPDAGLRFALPIAGIATRGTAAPGTTLPARRTDFDARHLGGGGAADQWTLAPETTRDLTALYREEAERAIRLGQHRRAAYVYAHLLGDLRAAANALERGRHWREAAALHRDRLNDKAGAADCLERGGLLTEAIALHLEIGDRLRAASLLDRVGRRAEAEALWRALVAERRADGDLVGAASLLSEQLRAPDEALATLDDGWPRGGHADRRLAAALDLLGAEGRDAEACRWVQRAGKVGETSPPDLAPIVSVLSGAAASHPDARCRDEAADAVRCLVGSALSARSPAGPLFLDALVATDRADRLLHRDASRFAADKRTRLPARRSRHGFELREVDLTDCDGTTAVLAPFDGGLLLLAARRGTGLLACAFDWDRARAMDRLAWRFGAAIDRPPLVRVDALRRRVIVALPGTESRLDLLRFATRGSPAWTLGTPAWVPDRLRGLCAGEALSTWTLAEPDDGPGLLATCHGAEGAALRTIAARGVPHGTQVPAACVGATLVLATPRLMRWTRKDGLETLGGDEPAVALVAAPLHLGSMLLAVGESGCRLFPELCAGILTGTPFAQDADRPTAAFLGDGGIAVLERGRVRLFRRDGHRMRTVFDERGRDDRVWHAVASGPTDWELAAIASDADGTPTVRLVRLRFGGS